MQMSLIHESITDAIREAVQAIGGNKALGALMFPDLPVDQAAGRVRDCLNPDRREHFTPEQLVMIARLAKAAGNSSIMEYLALDLGYLKPVAVEPEDEIARLQREFVQATKSLHNMASRIETITATAAMRRVA
jgi:hypothetical protein